MKRLLQILLILIALLVAAWFLLVDGLIESTIEREAGNALGARVEIDSVGLRLFPTAITLHGVQATNPRAPMRNLVTAESISADIDLGRLLDRRIVADTATLRGLRFDQPRAESGAIPGLTPEPEPAPPPTGIGLPDPERLAAESTARIQGELQRIGQEVEAVVAAWRERLATLPTRPAADALRGLEHQLQQDRARIQQQLTEARNLPETELGRLLGATGLDQRQPGNLSQALLAGEFTPLIARVLALADAAPGAGDAAGWPLLARRVALDGELALGASRLPFRGEIRNATPQPALWDVPLTFALDGGERTGQFRVEGGFDYRGAASGNLELALDRFNLSQLPLSRSELLGITLARGLTSAQGQLTLRGPQLDVSLDAQFREAALTIAAGDNPLARRAAQLLGAVDGFDLQLQVQGRTDAPQVTLRTSLDQPLDEALGQELQRQSAQLAGQLRAELERQLAPERTRIAQLTAEFNTLQQQLLERREAPAR